MIRLALPVAAWCGAISSIVGAVEHDAVITWTGVGIAVLTAAASAIILVYHRAREARAQRISPTGPQCSRTSRTRRRIQAVVEQRLVENLRRIANIEAHLERIACRHPNPDGTPCCSDPKARPPDCQLTPNGH